MKILVDADACPGDIKELIYRAAERLQVPATLVANKAMKYPRSPWISFVLVSAGLDVADAHIAQVAEPGDIVVTADIPLASLLVPKDVVVIDPRGELYSEANIGERLSVRNFMQDMRGAGLVSGGPRPFGQKDKQQFAATFDRELTRAMARVRSQKASDDRG